MSASQLVNSIKRKSIVPEDVELEEVEDSDTLPKFIEFDREIRKNKQGFEMVIGSIEIVDKGYILMGDCIILVYIPHLVFNDLHRGSKRSKATEEIPVVGQIIKVSGYITRPLKDGRTVYVTNTGCVDFVKVQN